MFQQSVEIERRGERRIMRVDVIGGRELTPELSALWSRYQQADAVLGSPFLRPEFTRAVASVREDVEIALLVDGNDVVGFFPYQRSSGNVGRPVGSKLSDFQAVIARSDVAWSADALVRGCGLAAWDYHQLVAEQLPFAHHNVRVHEGVYMNLANGYEDYQRGRRAAGSEKLKQIAKLTRRAEREVGPVRFVLHDPSRDVFEHLLAWKSAQYRSTNATDVLAFDWVIRLLQHVVAAEDDSFRGLLSALYLGDRLAAVELGLRSGSILHGWFPAYSRDFAFYSPGLMLTVELAKVAPHHGITRLDLGKNNLPYKSSFASDTYQVASGSVAVQPVAAVSRQMIARLRQITTGTWLRRPTRLVRDLARPLAKWMAMR